MLLILSFLLTPICICLAVWRLTHIPLHMGSGQLRLNTDLSAIASALAAYVALLGCTAALCVAIIRACLTHGSDAGQIVRLVLYFEAYPIVYIIAEWRFFYGLQRVPHQPALLGTLAGESPVLLHVSSREQC